VYDNGKVNLAYCLLFPGHSKNCPY